MECHFPDLPDFHSSEERLMTASAVHKLSEYYYYYYYYSWFIKNQDSQPMAELLTILQ